MSYLTDAVHAIEEKEGAAFYTIESTENVQPTNSLEAAEYAERLYKKQNRYSGAFHSVARK